MNFKEVTVDDRYNVKVSYKWHPATGHFEKDIRWHRKQQQSFNLPTSNSRKYVLRDKCKKGAIKEGAKIIVLHLVS